MAFLLMMDTCQTFQKYFFKVFKNIFFPLDHKERTHIELLPSAGLAEDCPEFFWGNLTPLSW